MNKKVSGLTMSGLAIRYGQISQQFLVGHFRRVTRWFRRGGAARPLWVPCFFVEKQQTGGRGTHLKVTGHISFWFYKCL